MKTVIAISLSFLIFTQSLGFGVSDIFMLKDLVEHAQYHSEEYGDGSMAFFKKHYGSLKAEHQKKHKEEKPEHEKLPFQHNFFNHIATEIVVPTSEFSLGVPVISAKANSNFHYENFYSFFEKTSILQPPKTA